ncbi:MAG: DUF2845 domain-containing protein [Gammaproteobacteria bacterium]
MNIKWIIGSGIILLMLAASPAFAWRCSHGLVDIGDSAASVRQRCGQPDFIYPDTNTSSRGRSGSPDARWYYNSGPSQLLRVLLIHKSVVQAIDTLGYGFNPVLRRCTPQDIRIGMSVYELASRCGKPRSKHVTHSGTGKRGYSGGAAVRTEMWTYDFGSQYLLQKVTLAAGQIQSVETASRHAKHSKPRG